MKYQHLFFDLDHTLWDFAKNSRETLLEAFDYFKLVEFGVDSNEFLTTYWRINDAYWDDYRKGRVTKEELRTGRFLRTLSHFHIKDKKLSVQLGDYYVQHSPKKSNVFPNTHETLNFLKNHYRLHIITNGFEEVQFVKLEKSNLAQYFEEVITSEAAGVKKPHEKIFHHALSATGAKNAETLMIGDNLEADIIGARNVGIDQVYFNPEKRKHSEQITLEISDLKELIPFLQK